MLEQTYIKWLGKEVTAVKCALLVALEERDNLLYIEEPALKEEYMQKIGVYEESVLRLELEVMLQEKKRQMIQAAINRREPIDLEKIEQMLEEERQKQLNHINETYKAGKHENGTLTAEEKEELQSLYKEIVDEFHPEVHVNITAYQKELYDKALEAYKRQNLEELRLIHEMLFDSGENMLSIRELSQEETQDMELADLIEDVLEDYSLAAELYNCFEALQEDAVLLETKKRYENKQAVALAEIEKIQLRFPFIAKATLREESKLKEYLDSLAGRKNSAENRLNELQVEIAQMIGE